MVESSAEKAAKIQKRRMEELQDLLAPQSASNSTTSLMKATSLERTEGESSQKRALEDGIVQEEQVARPGKKVKITPKKLPSRLEAAKTFQGGGDSPRKAGGKLVRKRDKALTIFSRRERQVKPPEIFESPLPNRGVKHSPSPPPSKEEKDGSVSEGGVIDTESSPEGAKRQAIIKPALLLLSEDEEPTPMDVVPSTKSLRNEERPDKAFLSERAKRHGLSNASSGRIFVTIPKDFFGPITAQYDPERGTGVKVGDQWNNRLECRQWGAHFPHIAGIAGKGEVGAQSVALSGGYEDDQDEGWFFIYTGSGGRDLSGNKRTNKEQSNQQVFERQNLALKVSCQEGYPVRVVRSHKEKRSQYAPKNGVVRYDGIYRIEKCWRKAGKQNALMCRFLFVRCDNEPAPWYKKGEPDHPDRPIPYIHELEGAQDVFERTKPAAWDWKENEGCWGWTRDPPVSREAGVKTPRGASKQPPAKKKKSGVASSQKSPRLLQAPPVNVLALTAPPKRAPADVTLGAIPAVADVIEGASPTVADVTAEVADVGGGGGDVTARDCKREYPDSESDAPVQPRAQKAIAGKVLEDTPAGRLGLSQEDIDRIRQYLGTSDSEDDAPLHHRSTLCPRVLRYDVPQDTETSKRLRVKQPGTAVAPRNLTQLAFVEPGDSEESRESSRQAPRSEIEGNEFAKKGAFADTPIEKGSLEVEAGELLRPQDAESLPDLNRPLQQDNDIAVCSVDDSAEAFAQNFASLTEVLDRLKHGKRQGLETGLEEGLEELQRGQALKRAADLLLHFNEELDRKERDNEDLRRQLEESERNRTEAERKLVRNCVDKACQAGSELDQVGLDLNQLTELRAELEGVKEGYMTLKGMAEKECSARKKAQERNKELESDLDEVRDRVLRLAEHCERLKGQRTQ